MDYSKIGMCITVKNYICVIYYSPESYKKMVGGPDGSIEKVRMDPSAMQVDIGKQERKENGMTVLIYLASSVKILVQLKGLNFCEVYIISWQSFITKC